VIFTACMSCSPKSCSLVKFSTAGSVSNKCELKAEENVKSEKLFKLCLVEKAQLILMPRVFHFP